jgi:16S rRNA (guanine966-N2)-methyltransferase
MTRVIAGSARGRRLAVPGAGTRPTADRVREAVFSAVTSALGSLGGAHVLDLYAGSGAVGIEALSRGAAHVLLVESDRKARDVVCANVATVGLPGAVVIGNDVSRVTSAAPPPGAQPPYDLVFADPPYDLDDASLDAVIAGLAQHGWLGEGSLVLVERPRRRSATTWPDGFEPGRERTYGETVVRSALWYGRDA